MKLNEVLIKNKVVKYNASAPLGSRYVVLDESTGRVISKLPNKHVAKTQLIEKQLLKENAPPAIDYTDFSAGEIFQTGQDRVAIGLGNADEVLEFKAEDGKGARERAQAFLDRLPAKHRNNPAKLKTAGRLFVKDISGFTQTLSRRVASATASTYDALEKLPVAGPTLQKLFTSPFARGVLRVIAVLPVSLIGTYYQMMQVINDLELEAEQNPQKAPELIELRNILVAQNIAMMGFMLFQITRNASLFNKALSAIKWTVRAAQGASAATGIGAIPSVISFLITEASWLIAGWIITSPTVQRAIAEWIQQSYAAAVFDLAGAAIVAAAGTLDAAFDGQFGTGALRDSLGFARKEPEAAPDGEFTSSSEWAKIVFHGILFPPGQEQQLVPYIGPEQRATLLRQTMGLTNETQGRGNGAAEVDRRRADAATSEPGMPVNPDARTGPQ